MPESTPRPSRRILPLRAAAVGAACSALLLTTTPALARPAITETEVAATRGRQVIHLRIQTGCGDLATDAIELRIPESVLGVVPETVAGWSVETEVSPTDEYELFGATQDDRVTAVRWSGRDGSHEHGGIVPIGQFQDFAIAAVFTEEGEIGFPVVQSCGLEEAAYTELPEGDEQPADNVAAPLLLVVPEEPEIDVAALDAAVAELRDTVEGLRTDLDDVPIPRLRERIVELEDRVDALEAATGGPEETPEAG